MPPPEGEPVILKPAEFTTTWSDADGGTITPRKDGTFVADKVCVAVSWYDSLAWSGTGTWEQGFNKEQSSLEVTFDAAHPDTVEREPGSYAALRQGKVLKLWTAIGDAEKAYQGAGHPVRVLCRGIASVEASAQQHSRQDPLSG
ncbi:hypothetical protein [Streptomyces sp. NPDC004284]|uniref:hypothetical protein n=1 Tax=Streptomyces sp. NPDC004284 TaxID=3364695 RepID=UPI00368E487C